MPLWAAIAAALALVTACVAPQGGAQTDAAPAAPAPAAPPPPPAPPAAFPETIARAGEQLLLDAQAAVGSGPRELIIDPLIDANTGQQTAGTVAMGEQMAALIKAKAPE